MNTNPSENALLPGCRLVDISPTVYFKRCADGLTQRVDVSLANNVSPGEMVLVILTLSGTIHFPLGVVPAGNSLHSIDLPETGRMAETKFSLVNTVGDLLDQKVISWQPTTRHWTIYVNPSSHHDLGYTDLPSNVLREHDAFLDDVIRFCEETADWPAESRFHYTIEQAWSVLHFLAHRSPELAQRLVNLIQVGQVEVNALFGNETSELCSHEEQIRLLYPAFRLQRRYGISIRTAELNDIPGVSWGLASVLAGAGIRYFAPGIPDYFAWNIKKQFIWDEQAVLTREVPGAFWWEGPDGQQVLFWYEGTGVRWSGMWSVKQLEYELDGCLKRLVGLNYPYDLLRARVQGGNRDNSPPDLRFSHIVRQWNERWAYPRLVLSTNTAFFETFESIAGSLLKTLRGDIPGTDYPIGAASTPAATAVNRNAHDTFAAADNLAACAALVTEMAYPAEQLAEACDQMLLYDEHTWGMAHPTGPAQDACWIQKAQFAYRAAALTHDILSKSVNLLADSVAIPVNTYAIVVFNPLAWNRTAPAAAEGVPTSPAGKPMHWQPEREGSPAHWNWGNAIGRHLVPIPAKVLDSPFSLVDLSTGKPVIHQVITLDDPLAARPNAAHRYALGQTDPSSVDLLNYDPAQRKELLFLAEDVPALGYKTYAILPTTAPVDPPEDSGELRAGNSWLDNRYYHIELDPTSGVIRSIFDKELGRELVDLQSEYGFNQLVGRSPRSGETTSPLCSTISAGESGPVCASLVVRGDGPGCPQRTQEIRLYAGLKRVDLATRLLRDSTPLLELCLAFPFAIEDPHWLYEAPHAAQKPITDQLPGSNTHAYAVQHWVNLANPDMSVAWTSLDAPVAAFGQLWPNPVSQAHHGATPPDFGTPYLRDPSLMRPGHLFSYLSVSNFRTNFQPAQPADLLFRFSLTSFPGNQPGRPPLRDFGWGTSIPLVTANIHRAQASGSQPVSASFCAIDAPNVHLGLKAAEDGDGLILRLFEIIGSAAQCKIHLPMLEIDEAWRTDLVERNQTLLPSQKHTIQVDIEANSVVTIRCKGNRAAFPISTSWWYD